jgi:hypothetical protein
MKSDNDRLYYAQRALIERARAESSKDSAAAIAHSTMAAEYERRARAVEADGLFVSRPWSVPRQEQSVH